ncbi:anaerobic ribonucleoside-triphosphate reductase activating protein [Calothrix sp. NIES-4071]|nr:anaerobic ribonucleoside-triphosphate reductase activating protein [Calothrix sp. NIES-4071]BAZ56803.1 anaerobic ribonucleoside-triphosphate reductase activating protein [Calothrix sp. NIES-4105]
MKSELLLLNIASWLPRSRANGPGTRMVIWLQGCPFRCPSCQNPDYLQYQAKHIKTVDWVWEVYQQIPNLTGISFSGGEPFAQAVALAELAYRVRVHGGNVVCWSGYQLSQLQQNNIPGAAHLLDEIDLLVDGLFIKEKAANLPLRGSSNQRLHFLSERITPDDLITIPRQEWTLTPSKYMYTGFPS